MPSLIPNADEIAAFLQVGTAAIAGEVVEYTEFGTYACTGSSVEIFAANAKRRGLIIQNKHGLNTLNLKFNGAATTNSIEIPPKGVFVMDLQGRDTRSVNLLGPNGSPFVAVEIAIP